MHHDELWQLYRRNGEAIPGAGWKSSRDNPYGEDDEIVGVAIVFLFRRLQNGEIEFLWQERSQKVDRFPGFYDLSAGGHINLGETVIEAAQREAREEIKYIMDTGILFLCNHLIKTVLLGCISWIGLINQRNFRLTIAKLQV